MSPKSINGTLFKEFATMYATTGRPSIGIMANLHVSRSQIRVIQDSKEVTKAPELTPQESRDLYAVSPKLVLGIVSGLLPPFFSAVCGPVCVQHSLCSFAFMRGHASFPCVFARVTETLSLGTHLIYSYSPRFTSFLYVSYLAASYGNKDLKREVL